MLEAMLGSLGSVCFSVRLYIYSLLRVILLVQAGYSVVAACLVTLRWKDKTATQISTRLISNRLEGVTCLTIIACSGFATGLIFRFSSSYYFLILPIAIAIIAAAALYFRQVSEVRYCVY